MEMEVGPDVGDDVAWAHAAKWRTVLDHLQCTTQLQLFSRIEEGGRDTFVPSSLAEDAWVAGRDLDGIFLNPPAAIVDEFAGRQRHEAAPAPAVSINAEVSELDGPSSDAGKRRGRITAEQKDRIPLEALTSTQEVLAAKYGVTRQRISAICIEAKKERAKKEAEIKNSAMSRSFWNK
ncbi:hypothetical protein OKW50_002738 [Paraburkholderia youngii]|uniref:hypothetical protein n=1 Tax=Paraburkholderia youngii TaxID=2782701 RepID=UPI003D1DBE54